MASTAARTYLAFQHNAKLHTLKTVVTAVRSFADLEEANRQLYKDGGDQDHVVVTEQTIFHPQGGGQPSDVGAMTTPAGASSFAVASVRMDAVRDGQVLHFGRFGDGHAPFRPGDEVEQAIDADKRLLYSRLHTAGHVLGAAVRHLLESEIEGFDELKASHFPDAASCEFQGSIDGRWKAPIQARVDEYVAAAMPVRVDFWDEDDFRRRGLERLIPDRSLAPPGEKFRVVEIVGAEVYPCGGTHVDTTDLCGETVVKKISRSKGNSKVSYTVK
ncbi:threonyl/alanyl tRNA synthetase [Colletotrichum sublineola]|uniref:Putative alanyl-tRNA synthetase n=1 Tax=Colletotrichum sublineola TaxID=1173701 RepID=A0A066XJC4_COLSU|nr:threonyl/alanyl tRNA synthetase [Colletotrichum sublineola]KDN67739.1 putative alanyl-tRNA synthetase [Colletotrichum sublineola]